MKFTILFLLLVIPGLSRSKEIVMKHMPEGKNCIICHRPSKPDHLLLRDGSRIELKQVTLLCGQCHSIKYGQWSEGKHGKVTGSWMPGKQKRSSCIECHNPHAPKFPQYEAKLPPVIGGKEKKH